MSDYFLRMTIMHYLQFETPLGSMLALADEHGISGVYFTDQFNCPAIDELTLAESGTACDSILQQAARQIQDYFVGKRQCFDLPLNVRGTPFQQQVWRAVQQIGFGQTTSYLSLARGMGKESAVRAVGAAIGRNPVLLLTPCHRIVGSNGSLTGFAGGLERKHQLLELEKRG